MIKKFSDFEPTNEGFDVAASAAALLLALGIGSPSSILPNKERIESAISGSSLDTLGMLASERDSLIGKQLPINMLADTIIKFNASAGKNLRDSFL